ncbi:Uncharacterised protein [Neisseria sicca]|nr:Uncharacterised protein [Neisseria sicca]
MTSNEPQKLVYRRCSGTAEMRVGKVACSIELLGK